MPGFSTELSPGQSSTGRPLALVGRNSLLGGLGSAKPAPHRLVSGLRLWEPSPREAGSDQGP